MHNKKVNRSNLAITALTIIMLVGTSLISISASTTDNAFAKIKIL